MFKIIRTILFRKRINTARRIALGFAVLILAGTMLIMLPVSSRTGEVTPFLTALFTATSATCVTGLSLVNTGAYFTFFGQVVLLFLIQLGGLGFMTILCLVFLVSNRHIGLRNRMMIAQSMGTESLEGIVKLVKHVLLITISVEIAGAALLSVRFIPHQGLLRGIWYGIFHSVSAFCNAGFDIIGDGQSVVSYSRDPLVLITLACLIIIGGLGFIVWEDILKKKSFRKLSMYSKTVMLATVFLLVIGTVLYFVMEYNNPHTMGNDGFEYKLLTSFFQSVTTRTAGFASVSQNDFTDLSKVWGIILMMVGGASGSTAGGVKVGTVVLILLALKAVLSSKNDVVAYGRRIGHGTILHAMSLFVMWLVLTLAGSMLVAAADNQTVINSLYEVASAYSTVGLSVGICDTASVFTKILLIIYMFFGRVGIMTISVMFMTRTGKSEVIKYPKGNFIVG